MADKITRVRILRTVQGEGTENDEREILVKGSVVDLRADFAGELIGSKAAEETDDKVVKMLLHPKADAAAAK